MYNYHCLNPIAQIGLDIFNEAYQKTDAVDNADAILVRSAAMHDMEFSTSLFTPGNPFILWAEQTFTQIHIPYYDYDGILFYISLKRL